MSEAFRTGDRVAAYTLLFRLGKGGMGEVWAARRGSKATPIAMKLLKARTDKKSPMFLDEARTAAALRHPHIVSTFESGVERGLMYIAMELVPGPSLHSLQKALKRSGQRMPSATVRDVGIAVADALAYASEVKVNGRRLDLIHRDISPHNILASVSGRSYLSDFGVARTTYQLHETMRGEIRGKPGYMSPEQVNEESLDARSDLFCLGIVLWELATQQRLFKRATLLKALVAVAEEPAPDVRDIEPGLPAAFAAAIARCLDKDPAHRFQSAAELRTALEALDHLGPRSEANLAHLISASYPDGTFDVAAKTAQIETRPLTPAPSTSGTVAALDDSFSSVPTLSRGKGPVVSAPDLVIPRRRPIWPLVVAVLSGVVATLALLEFGGTSLLPEPPASPPLPSAAAPTKVESPPSRVLAPAQSSVPVRAREGDLDALRALIESGSDVDARGELGWHGLHYAVQAQHSEVLSFLLEADADPNPRTEDTGDAPLHLAARYGRANYVKLLLEGGADPDLRNFALDTAAHAAMMDPSGEPREVLRALKRRGGDLASQGALGHTPLLRAVVQGHETGVRALLRMGVRPKAPHEALVLEAARYPTILRMILKVLPRRAVNAELLEELEARGERAALQILRQR
ncbi:MAG: protein kinase [Myxococcota bacterium]